MRVLVTRPLDEGLHWVEALAREHIDALALPLIRILPAPDPAAALAAWAQLAHYDAVMFVSAAAADHFFAVGVNAADTARSPASVAVAATAAAGAAGVPAGWPGTRRPRAWAPGPGSVRALQRLGVPIGRIDAPDPHAGQFDSEALWLRVGASVTAGDRVLVVRGADADHLVAQTPGVDRDPVRGHGRDWLAQRLTERGAHVDFVVAYRRAAPSPAQVRAALAQAQEKGADLWLFTSALAIRNLTQALPQHDWSGERALVTHPRIADTARAAGFAVLGVSRPALADVVASIKSLR